jgi:hypothetical protein
MGTRRLLLPVAIPQEVFCGTVQALPTRPHRCARDRSDERNTGEKG